MCLHAVSVNVGSTAALKQSVLSLSPFSFRKSCLTLADFHGKRHGFLTLVGAEQEREKEHGASLQETLRDQEAPQFSQ